MRLKSRDLTMQLYPCPIQPRSARYVFWLHLYCIPSGSNIEKFSFLFTGFSCTSDNSGIFCGLNTDISKEKNLNDGKKKNRYSYSGKSKIFLQSPYYSNDVKNDSKLNF